MRDAWAEVIGTEPGELSAEADFFTDLGGHSLLAARAVSVLRGRPGTAGATLRDMYEHPTVRALAARLRSSPGPLPARRRGSPAPPPPAQPRTDRTRRTGPGGGAVRAAPAAHGTGGHLVLHASGQGVGLGSRGARHRRAGRLHRRTLAPSRRARPATGGGHQPRQVPAVGSDLPAALGTRRAGAGHQPPADPQRVAHDGPLSAAPGRPHRPRHHHRHRPDRPARAAAHRPRRRDRLRRHTATLAGHRRPGHGRPDHHRRAGVRGSQRGL